MPSITAKKMRQVIRLFRSGYTLDQVRKLTGIGRHSLEAIRAGKKRDCNGLYVDPNDVSSPGGVYVRCPGCRGKVRLPCQLCRIRAIQAENKESSRPFQHISEE